MMFSTLTKVLKLVGFVNSPAAPDLRANPLSLGLEEVEYRITGIFL
jgi:hypothetical protein